jgi:hypothetical protein
MEGAQVTVRVFVAATALLAACSTYTPKVVHLGDQDGVAKRYRCGQSSVPFAKVERNIVKPRRVPAGSNLLHRLVYAVCMQEPSGIARGTLSRKVYLNERLVAKDVEEGFEVKAGRTLVDRIIDVPANAQPGLYMIRVEFNGGRVEFQGSQSFEVEPAER